MMLLPSGSAMTAVRADPEITSIGPTGSPRHSRAAPHLPFALGARGLPPKHGARDRAGHPTDHAGALRQRHGVWAEQLPARVAWSPAALLVRRGCFLGGSDGLRRRLQSDGFAVAERAHQLRAGRDLELRKDVVQVEADRPR